MRRPAFWLLASLLLMTCSAPASATVWGPLTIYDIQNETDPPNPVIGTQAVGDTVGPVCGIITGFDNFPTGFAVYIQSSQGGAWTGIDAFTGGLNTQCTLNLVLGDSLCVEGALLDFQGETEIAAKNGAFGGDIVLNKISSGHPLPPFHIGMVAELQELATNPNAEQWEGCLVRVEGPLRIVRTTCASGCTGGLGTFHSSLVVDDTVCPDGTVGPCDSMFIDLSTLGNPALNPGSVGQVLTYAQGIFNQRTRGHRIQARDANDYGLPVPPGVARAFSIGSDTILVLLDRDVTVASAEDEANYSLASFGTVDVATRVAGNVVHLRVTNGLAAGDPEGVTVSNLVAEATGVAMTAPQGLSFRNGLVTPAMIQGPNPDSLVAPGGCKDVANYLGPGPGPGGIGERVSFRGICTSAFLGQNLFNVQGVASGQRNAVLVFAPPCPLTPGRQYVLSAAPQEFFGETEMTGVVYVRDEGPATIPAPTVQPVSVLRNIACDYPGPGLGVQTHLNTGEDWEGMLVKVVNVVVRNNRNAGQNFFVIQPWPTPTDTILIDNDAAYAFNPDSLQLLDVTGVLQFSFGAFRIAPRSDADINLKGVVGIPGLDRGRLDLRAWPNPASRFNIAFNLPRADQVDLGVFDLMGREVASLASGRYEAGVHTLQWDGRQSDGTRARSGVYFYRLKVAGEELIQKFVRLQ